VQRHELDAHLDTVLIGGSEQREVVIADYDPSGPVPGLAAKPIVDVLVAVDDADDEPGFGPALERTGYELRVREPGHRMYRTPQRDVQVHVWNDDDRQIARYLAFGDRVRESAADRGEYERLTRSLAEREWSDINHYAQAKGPLIEAILVRAAGHDAGPQAAARIQLERVLDRRDAGVLVYELNREPVALVAYESCELIAAVEAIARRRDCYRIELTTRPDRPDALGLYLACGFAERPSRLVKVIDDG
jgi:hypothetical protein